MFQDDDDEVALEGPGDSFFAISRVSKVVDPTNGAAIDPPEDLVEWFTTHPALTSETPSALTIAGLAAQLVDAKVTDGSEQEIFAFPSGNLRIPAGVSCRVHVVPLDGPDLTVLICAPNDGFAETVEAFQPFLDSMSISGG